MATRFCAFELCDMIGQYVVTADNINEINTEEQKACLIRQHGGAVQSVQLVSIITAVLPIATYCTSPFLKVCNLQKTVHDVRTATPN